MGSLQYLLILIFCYISCGEVYSFPEGGLHDEENGIPSEEFILEGIDEPYHQVFDIVPLQPPKDSSDLVPYDIIPKSSDESGIQIIPINDEDSESEEATTSEETESDSESSETEFASGHGFDSETSESDSESSETEFASGHGFDSETSESDSESSETEFASGHGFDSETSESDSESLETEFASGHGFDSEISGHFSGYGPDDEDYGESSGGGYSGSGDHEIDSSLEFSFEKSEENEEPLKVMCSHTGYEMRPWWRVDLEDTYVVEKIVIYNRAQGLHQRLHDIEIRVGSKDVNFYSSYFPSFARNELCALKKGILPPGESIIECDKPVEGRYVSIQITEGIRNSLTLCEVEVYGSSLQKPFGNVAKKKPTLQSGVSWDGIPSRAVDGIISAQYFAGEEHMSCINANEGVYSFDTSTMSPPPRDCAEIYHQGKRQSGVYTIYPKPWIKSPPFQVFCDMSSDGGGWTTILRRHYYLDHSESFHRFLKDYIEGFGELCEEFWIGNDNLYILTTQNSVHLKVEIHDSYGQDTYAFYERFMISDKSRLYRMHLHGYNGTAGDYLRSDVPFTLRPKEGGWWWSTFEEGYHAFLGSNPNGDLWHGPNVSEPITWGCQECHSEKNYYIQFFEMKTRPVWFEYLIRYGRR